MLFMGTLRLVADYATLLLTRKHVLNDGLSHLAEDDHEENRVNENLPYLAPRKRPMR